MGSNFICTKIAGWHTLQTCQPFLLLYFECISESLLFRFYLVTEVKSVLQFLGTLNTSICTST